MDDGDTAMPDMRKAKKSTTRAPNATDLMSPIPIRVNRSVKTRTATMARNAVFDTTELLENILVHLPLRDLLLAQRVNHNFKNVIESSPAAQSLLHPTLEPSNKRWGFRYDDRREHEACYVSIEKRHVAGLRVLSLNQDLFIPLHEDHLITAGRYEGEEVVFRTKKMEQGLLHYMRGHKQSHEHMYITQPHCTQLRISYKIVIGAHATVKGRSIVVRMEGEPTVADIFETILGVPGKKTRHDSNVVVVEKRSIPWSWNTVKEDHPLDRRVSETIGQLEKEHKSAARVARFSIFLPRIITPTQEEIEEVESADSFTAD